MAPASIGPVKAMVRSLHAADLEARLKKLLKSGSGDVRQDLLKFAKDAEVAIS